MSRKRSMRALSPMFVTLPSTRSETRNRLRSHHSRLRFKADLTQGRDDVEEMLGGKLPPILPLHSNSRKQHDRAGLPALSGLVNGFGPTGGVAWAIANIGGKTLHIGIAQPAKSGKTGNKQPGLDEIGPSAFILVAADGIGRASCRERVCQNV